MKADEISLTEAFMSERTTRGTWNTMLREQLRKFWNVAVLHQIAGHVRSDYVFELQLFKRWVTQIMLEYSLFSFCPVM